MWWCLSRTRGWPHVELASPQTAGGVANPDAGMVVLPEPCQSSHDYSPNGRHYSLHPLTFKETASKRYGFPLSPAGAGTLPVNAISGSFEAGPAEQGVTAAPVGRVRPASSTLLPPQGRRVPAACSYLSRACPSSARAHAGVYRVAQPWIPACAGMTQGHVPVAGYRFADERQGSHRWVWLPELIAATPLLIRAPSWALPMVVEGLWTVWAIGPLDTAGCLVSRAAGHGSSSDRRARWGVEAAARAPHNTPLATCELP